MLKFTAGSVCLHVCLRDMYGGVMGLWDLGFCHLPTSLQSSL